MKSFVIMFAATLLAGTALAQGADAPGGDAAVAGARQFSGVRATVSAPARTNYHLHARLFDECCGVGAAASGGSSSSSGASSAAYQDTVVTAGGDANWVASRYVKFAKAVRLGAQQAPVASGAAPTPDAVQQMLYLMQQERVEAAAAAARGEKPGAADSAVAPQPSSYVPYDQALALGEQQRAAAQASANAEPLGDVARDDQQQKAAEPKAAVKIKQDADGNPVIVDKKPR